MDLSPGGSVALGILVGLISTSIQSVGLTLQRKSHILEEEKEEQDGAEIRPPYRRRRWQIGMAMFLVSNIVGSTIQITTLPLPVLSTLQASGLVFNTACATLILHEPFTRYSLIGTVLVAAGAILIATFGALAEPSHNLDQLLILLSRTGFLLWLVATFLVTAAIILGAWIITRLYPRPSARIRLLLGMAYGGISGILSAHTLLLAKSAVELLVRTIADKVNQFNRWQSWMILLGLVFLALSQLYYLHRGLKLCSTSVLYPFVFCIYNIIAILDGLIYFDQSSRLSITHACLIAVGTVVLLIGVFALSWRLSDESATHHRSASVSGPLDSKALAHRIPPPQSALGPGLGLVDADPDVLGEDAPRLRPADEEEALANVRSLRPNETTPLLRTSTAPMGRRHSGRRQKRPSQTRRSTLQEEQTNLWDELNDRQGSAIDWQMAPGGSSPARSPTSSRHLAKFNYNAKRPGTLPARRSTLQIPIWNFTWTRPRARGIQRASSDEDDHVDMIDGEDPVAEGDAETSSPVGTSQQRRRSLPQLNQARGKDTLPLNWFRLPWWKQKRRASGDSIST